MKQWHAYSICCGPEVAGGIVLICDVTAVQDYVMVNFEVASCSIFGDDRKQKYFLTLKFAVATMALTLFVADRK